MRRIRAGERRIAVAVIEPSPVAIDAGVFQVRSSWEIVEDTLRRWFGKPRMTYLQYEHSAALGRQIGGRYAQRANRASVRQRLQAGKTGFAW
jgi:hypothetical protein